MPQVYTASEFEKLNTQGVLRWEDLVQENWNLHTHWDATYPANPLASLAAQQRLFYPRSFTISSSLTSLNNPWFIDYGHLMFWFFFLSTFILVMWLVTLHGLAAKNVEARLPRRETRGFSRAQTGDVMTAVLPLTWSITMLMHASTHSINFDENTAATSFSFTVIAYQWGWNYYFPRDIVEKLTKAPRLVGRGHVDMNGADAGYSHLLERARNEYMARLTLRGAFADRSGREVAANFLTLFTRAGGASAAQVASSALTAVWNASTPLEPERLSWRNNAGTSLLGRLAKTACVETLSDVSRTPSAWASAAVGEARLTALRPTNKRPSDLALRTPADYRLSKALHLPKTFPSKAKFSGASCLAAQKKTSVLNTARAPHSFALVGNRLSLIHKHLTSAAALPPHLSWKPRAAFFISSLRKKDQSLAPLHLYAPSWASLRHHSTPLRFVNASPNLWRPFAAAPLHKPFNFDRFLQARLYTGSPYALSFESASMATQDDLGPNNGAATKETAKRLLAYSACSAASALNATHFAPSTDAVFPNPASAQNRKLLNASANGRNFLSTSHASHPATGAALATLAQNPEVAASPKPWVFAATLSLLPAPSYAKVRTAASALPSSRLTAAASFYASTNNPAFFAKLTPFTCAGGSLSGYFAANFTAFTRPVVSLPAAALWSFPANNALPCLTPLLQNACSVFSIPPLFKMHTHPKFTGKVRGNGGGAIAAPALPFLPHRPGSNRKLSPAPMFDAPRRELSAPTLGKLFSLGGKAKSPALYSPWLEGPTPARPVRSTSDKSNDLANFTGKSDLVGGQPFFANKALFNWYWAWSGSTSVFSLPLNKLYRGALTNRAVGGFWNNGLGASPLNAALFPESLIGVSKNASLALVGGFTYKKQQPAFSLLSTATLDSDWVALAQTPACLTPEPFEDVDQAFVHQKWTLDLNTARRSDHTSKFKVTWGPWAQYKKAPTSLAKTSPQAFAGVVGSSTALGLTAKQSLATALYSESTLPLKTSAGVSHLLPTAVSGAFYLDPRIGANLYNALAPRSSLAASAQDWSLTLSPNRRHKFLTKAPSFAPNLSLGWASLWSFKTNVSDVQMAFTRPHTSAYPTYWADRALLVLSAREKIKAAVTSSGSSFTPPTQAIGAQHPLLRDITALYLCPANRSKAFSLNRAAWSNMPSTNGWRASLEAALAKALDASVDAHLMARSQYSLAKDDIGSIRRLRVTKGIYLPSDVPMHVVCGSKDVIHSWALPGLNIKIDCIPGFNSHRRLMLRWRGAYWGQCMEVCGRYHHWMPILIHVVHKDIFLGWCLSYLKLIEARAQATGRALALLATVDLLTLESTLTTLLRVTPLKPYTLQGLSNYIVHSDLED